MHRVLSIVAASACFFVLAFGALPAFSQAIPGWVMRPATRSAAQSSQSVSLSGYVLVPGQTLTISAIDQNIGNRVIIGTTTASTVGKSYFVLPLGPRYLYPPPRSHSYLLYPWKFEAGVLAANYWAPQEQFGISQADVRKALASIPAKR
jgi:hypothetical protein